MGQGQVKPVEAKVEAISDFPVPTGKRQLMRFLGMAGYYRKFCNNFSVIAEPLTNFTSAMQWHLSPRKRIWDDIIFSLNMSDVEIVLLQHETPSE